MITVPLDKQKHDRKGFDCGVEALNRYLMLVAQQQADKDNTRTFVLEDQQTDKIIGYYTLTMTSLNLTALPQKLQKKHQSAHSAGLIARLAVDKSYFKQGYGEWLLIDALHKLLIASESVAFPVVVVDAKQGITAFYQKMGFMPFKDTRNKLFMTLADVRHSLNQRPLV